MNTVPRFKHGMNSKSISPSVAFAADLIRCASVTPLEAGTLDLLEERLNRLGFVCRRYPFGEGVDKVDNLYARLGEAAPNFCFAGHVDVVPEGDKSRWTHAPFDARVENGEIWGRGAADMKGAIAAFVVAVEELLSGGWKPAGSISFLITGDEEGPAINGTDKLLDAIITDGETLDHCLVGEPTNPDTLGEMIKNGRRGSLNAKIKFTGQQGHVAYPHRASNPVPALLGFLTRVQARNLDDGNAYFQPSNLEVTSVDVGNPAHNVIPETARAQFNIRFNTEHRGDDLKAWIEDEVSKTDFAGEIEADLRVTGEAFLTEPCGFTSLVQDSVESVTGRRPELSTSGGTSDARYITRHAPVIEFGLIGATMHQVDERVAVSDIEDLTRIYRDILTRYFA